MCKLRLQLIKIMNNITIIVLKILLQTIFELIIFKIENKIDQKNCDDFFKVFN